jgi:hypothetical protein
MGSSESAGVTIGAGAGAATSNAVGVIVPGNGDAGDAGFIAGVLLKSGLFSYTNRIT